MRHQHDAVPQNCAFGVQRRRIKPHKKRERRETRQNYRRNCEAHQDCDRCLPEGLSRSENLRKHSIDRAVAKACEKNHERKFYCGVERLQWTSPQSERGTIEASADQDDQRKLRDRFETRSRHRLSHPIRIASQENLESPNHGLVLAISSRHRNTASTVSRSVDVPAVKPTTLIPSNHSERSSSGRSM